ncbi:hypothetical protein IKP13_00645, partial [bacterium]|nr:hypothetical protein [bacterium]
MWELIRINKRKSLFVLILMFILMVSLSGAVGAGFYTVDWVTGMIWGALIGVVLWAVQAAVAYFAGDDIVLHF